MNELISSSLLITAIFRVLSVINKIDPEVFDLIVSYINILVFIEINRDFHIRVHARNT